MIVIEKKKRFFEILKYAYYVQMIFQLVRRTFEKNCTNAVAFPYVSGRHSTMISENCHNITL